MSKKKNFSDLPDSEKIEMLISDNKILKKTINEYEEKVRTFVDKFRKVNSERDSHCFIWQASTELQVPDINPLVLFREY